MRTMIAALVAAPTNHQVLAFSENEFREQINLASYGELFDFCKYLEIFANGSADELQTRLCKHKNEFYRGEIVPKSPEGCDARERQVRLGAAAAKLRANAAKICNLKTQSWTKIHVPIRLCHGRTHCQRHTAEVLYGILYLVRGGRISGL